MKNFSFKLNEDGVELRLHEEVRKLFKTSKNKVLISDWGDLSLLRQIEAVGLLQMAEEEELDDCVRLPDDSGYQLSFDFISKLSEAQAQALNLPRVFPHQIKIQTSSNIGSPDFSIDWFAFGEGRLIPVKKDGCFVKWGDDIYRIPKDILSIIDCIDNNKQSIREFDNKMAFVAELKSLLPLSSNNDVQFEGELHNISLRHASAFSLQITGNKNSLNFNPVLFNKAAMIKASESDELFEEDEQILTQNEARNFSAAFRKKDAVKSTYLVGTNANYVFIDRSLKPALDVVRSVAMSNDKEQRAEFARSPQSFIRAAFEEKLQNLSDIEKEIEAQSLDWLFIETRQFSDRVTEMGVWERPKLPWLESEPNEWRADCYCWHIQNKVIHFPISDLETVIKTLQKAIKTNADSCLIGGEKITPDKKFLTLLEGLLPKRPDKNDDRPSSDGQTTGEGPSDGTGTEKPSGPIVPLTKENFESVEYNRRFKPRNNPLSDERTPECLASSTSLKDHQKIGIDWLVETYNRGFPGVLMADDMGLGKTLQALAFLALMVEEGKTDNGEPILIVAPVGLLKNWEEEHKKHLSTPGLGRFGKLYGNSLKDFKTSKGRDIETGVAALDADRLKGYDWLLTTYETLRDYQTSFGQVKFSCVVFDELQKAKNPTSLACQGTKVLNSAFSIGLTGTPVENSLADLWTITDILSPGRLKDLKTFLKEYPVPDSTNPEIGLKKLEALSEILLKPSANGPAPVLRRMKTDLSDMSLPEKILIPSSTTTQLMPEMQNSAYTAISNKLNGGQMLMIEALHSFKTVSLHPISPEQFDQFSSDDYINASARLKITFEILDDIHKKNEKVLLFIESRALQPIIASIIKQKYKLTSIPLIINGLVNSDARQEKVTEFQESPDGFNAMIISPKAGGVGLTITAANNVIHVERWWNPAVEDQCTDRAYRIGQTKTVRVYTPISKNESFGEKSFDCILDKLLDSKRSLAKGIFIPTAIGNKDFSGVFKDESKPEALKLDDIDCLEFGTDFEAVVMTMLKRFSLKVSGTQTSYDYGADIIVENTKTGKSAIIQCKHRSSGDKSVSDDAVTEVTRATGYYDLNEPKLFIVTNATSVTSSCQKRSAKEGVILVLRDDLLNVGTIVNEQLK